MSERRPSEKAQRLRLRFARGPAANAIGHLDLARCWERAFRDAGIAVSYSQGSRPSPRLTIAAGLPTNVTSDGELLDLILAERIRPDDVIPRIGPHLPPGLRALDVWEVGTSLPSLPTVVRWAEYEVDVPATIGRKVSEALDSLLAAERFPWEDTRGERVRHYDLRPMIGEIGVVEQDEGQASCEVRLVMRLRCDSGGVGRPDQIVKALGLPVASRIHRRRLLLSERSPAHDAWRRSGRYAG